MDKRQLALLGASFALLVILVFSRPAKDAVRAFVARFLPSLQGLIRAEILALLLVGLVVVYLAVPQADQKILQFLGVGRRRRRGLKL